MEGKGNNLVHQEYFSISDLAKYSGISQRTLWDLLKDSINPIPHFRIGAAGRIVRVKKSEFDEWIQTQKVGDPQLIDQIVDEVLK